jgi:glycosyltransferase involved in cell wall biosynthesis
MITERPPPPPRVVVLGPLPPPLHGMSLVTQRMAARLQAEASATVIDVSPGAVYDRARWRGRAVKFARLLRAWVRLPGLRRRGHRWLYLPLDSRSGLWLNLATVMTGRALGFRLLLHHHVTEYLVRRHWALALLDRMIGPAGAHLFSCERFIAAFRRLYGSRRPAWPLSNAAFLAAMAPAAESPPPRPLTLGHLSNLSREKGLHDVLDAFTALRRSGLDVRLVLAGPCGDAGDRARISAVAAAHGPLVEARGAVTGAAKQRFYAEIDVFLFPTRYPLESEPLVVLEALQAGRPVLAFAEGCIAELIGDDGGAAVPPGRDFTAACARASTARSASQGGSSRAQAAVRLALAEAQFAAVLALLSGESGAGGAGVVGAGAVGGGQFAARASGPSSAANGSSRR